MKRSVQRRCTVLASVVACLGGPAAAGPANLTEAFSGLRNQQSPGGLEQCRSRQSDLVDIRPLHCSGEHHGYLRQPDPGGGEPLTLRSPSQIACY
jgi:hypothetical protein